jgi:hypothetical protein
MDGNQIKNTPWSVWLKILKGDLIETMELS